MVDVIIEDKLRERLSGTPSKLIRQALADLEKVEKMPDEYKVNMQFYHERLFDEKCYVCFAGAVMVGAGCPHETVHPNHLVDSTSGDRLRALDSFRLGDVSDGLSLMGYGQYHDFARVKITRYHESPTLFKEEMSALADQLEKQGL